MRGPWRGAPRPNALAEDEQIELAEREALDDGFSEIVRHALRTLGRHDQVADPLIAEQVAKLLRGASAPYESAKRRLAPGKVGGEEPMAHPDAVRSEGGQHTPESRGHEGVTCGPVGKGGHQLHRIGRKRAHGSGRAHGVDGLEYHAAEQGDARGRDEPTTPLRQNFSGDRRGQNAERQGEQENELVAVQERKPMEHADGDDPAEEGESKRVSRGDPALGPYDRHPSQHTERDRIPEHRQVLGPEDSAGRHAIDRVLHLPEGEAGDRRQRHAEHRGIREIAPPIEALATHEREDRRHADDAEDADRGVRVDVEQQEERRGGAGERGKRTFAGEEKRSQYEQRARERCDPQRVVERREDAPAMQRRGVLEEAVCEGLRQLAPEELDPALDAAREADQHRSRETVPRVGKNRSQEPPERGEEEEQQGAPRPLQRVDGREPGEARAEAHDPVEQQDEARRLRLRGERVVEEERAALRHLTAEGCVLEKVLGQIADAEEGLTCWRRGEVEGDYGEHAQRRHDARDQPEPERRAGGLRSGLRHEKKRYRRMWYSAASPSRHVIFLPSS